MEAWLLALCAWSRMCVVKRAPSHKVTTFQVCKRAPESSALQALGPHHCSSRLPAVAARRLAYIEGKQTKENTNMHESKQTQTKETAIRRPGNVLPGHPQLLGHLSSSPLPQPSDGRPLYFVQGFWLYLAGRWGATCRLLLLWNRKLCKPIISPGLFCVQVFLS